MDKFRYVVTAADVNYKVKDILRHQFAFSARLRTKLKKNNSVYLNGEPVAGWILPKEGDVISVRLPEEMSGFEPSDVPVLPVYEDDDLLIINKPPGYVVHPSRGQQDHTMANGIQKYMLDTGQHFKIRFANRLDRDTSGILVIAKNSYSQEELIKQMKLNITRKYYKAVLCGIIESDEGTIDFPIGRPDPNRIERGFLPEEEGGYASVTHYKVLRRRESELIRLDASLTVECGYVEGQIPPFSEEDRAKYEQAGLAEKIQGLTLAEILLETGRTHQIRVHMGHSGNFVCGDSLYGGVACKRDENGLYAPVAGRQLLHASRLYFRHPITQKEIEVEAPLPADFSVLDEI